MEEKLNTSALRALLAKATPGPWIAVTRAACSCGAPEKHGAVAAQGRELLREALGNTRAAADARAIVAIINAAPALLDRAERHDALVREALVSAGLHADGDAIQLVRDVAAALVETRGERDEARKIAATEAHARHAAEAAMDEALGMLDDGDETMTAEETARALVDAAREMRRERDAAREAHEDSYARYLAADAERERLREAVQSMAARREMAERERDAAQAELAALQELHAVVEIERDAARVALDAARGEIDARACMQEAQRQAGEKLAAELAALRAAVERAVPMLEIAAERAESIADLPSAAFAVASPGDEDRTAQAYRDGAAALRALLAATKGGAR